MKPTTISNNKRIAKNTIMLYIRMLLIMAVTLYTSRVVLNALGIEDFGIYNAVGGVVSLFAIISNSLSAAISRFITFELGTGNNTRLRIIFSTSLLIQISIALIIILLVETIGLWFLNSQMEIPPNRLSAANWVLQFSVLTFAINLISVPYNALIIAYEKMSAFAYISVFEAICRLGIAYLITISPVDRLIFYSALMMLAAILIRFVYGVYCGKHFEESHFQFSFDKNLFKEMYGFAGWNFIGASSGILRDQGGNILLNLFFGPIANAARGIAMQVNHAVSMFIQNFTTALNPQITKSFANGNHTYMMDLLFKGSRFSFYLLSLISIPILIKTQYILALWLGNVPEHTIFFVQLILFYSLSESLSAPLITAMLATGNIRNYQIVVGGLQLLNVPVSYLCFRFGISINSIFWVALFISIICLSARIVMLHKMIQFPIRRFLVAVCVNAVSVFVVAIVLPLLLAWYIQDSLIGLCLICVISLLSSILSIYYVGCNKEERNFIYSKVSYLIRKYI